MEQLTPPAPALSSIRSTVHYKDITQKMPRSMLIEKERLVHTSVQIHHNVDGRDQDLGGDEDNDYPFKVFA